MPKQHRSFSTIHVAFVAAITSLTNFACANGSSEATPATEEPLEAEPAAAEATRLEEGAACPMLAEAVVVDTVDTPDGVALRFTTASGDVEELRIRVEHLANMYEMHAGHGSIMWQHMGHMRAEGEQPGMGGPMPAATARSEAFDDGAQLVLTPRDPAELDALREQVREHQKHLSAGECWIAAA